MRLRNGLARATPVLAAALLAAACTRGEPLRDAAATAAPQPVVDDAFLVMQELMEWVVDPAAGVVFAAAGRDAPPDRRPAGAPAWQAVADAAERLVEQGGALMQPALTERRADWLGLAAAMQRSASEAMHAARAHDADRAARASDALRASCQGCHVRYAPALAQRLGETRNP